jgi:hypothetical protein
MSDQNIQQGVYQLLSEVGALPEADRVRLESLAQKAREQHQELKLAVSGLNESVDYLRLSIKYLLFDLEATRRENAELRRMLEGQPEQESEGEFQ